MSELPRLSTAPPGLGLGLESSQQSLASYLDDEALVPHPPRIQVLPPFRTSGQYLRPSIPLPSAAQQKAPRHNASPSMPKLSDGRPSSRAIAALAPSLQASRPEPSLFAQASDPTGSWLSSGPTPSPPPTIATATGRRGKHGGRVVSRSLPHAPTVSAGNPAASSPVGSSDGDAAAGTPAEAHLTWPSSAPPSPKAATTTTLTTRGQGAAGGPASRQGRASKPSVSIPNSFSSPGLFATGAMAAGTLSTATSGGLGPVVGLRAERSIPDNLVSRSLASLGTDAGPGPSMMGDLMTATRKAIAAAMGEWDLRPLEGANEAYQNRLLVGALGPESLKHRHGMSEKDLVPVYRALAVCTQGFCAAVSEPLGRAREPERLLGAILEACAGLWSEALGVHVACGPSSAAYCPSCGTAPPAPVLLTAGSAGTGWETAGPYGYRISGTGSIDGLSFPNSQYVLGVHGTGGPGAWMVSAASAEVLVAQLGEQRAETHRLQARLTEVLQGGMQQDQEMRSLQSRAVGIEGEALMLGRTSEQLGVRLAASEVKVASLGTQLEEAAAARKVAEAAMAEAVEGQRRLMMTLREQQGTLAKQSFQVAELEKVLRTLTIELAEEKRAHAAAESQASDTQLRDDCARQVADATRAYRLLHSDYIVKMHDVEGLREANRKLEGTVKELQGRVLDLGEGAERRCQAAQARENEYRSRWERTRSCMEDLEAQTTKLRDRNASLVASYWPLMDRLKEAEAAVREEREAGAMVEGVRAELKERVEGLGRQLEEAEAMKNELAKLRSELKETRASCATLQSCLDVCQKELGAANEHLKLLQEQHWAVKAKLLEAELQNDSLVAARDRAQQSAQYVARLKGDAEEQKLLREKLESELVGCKAWIRNMEETEREYRSVVSEARQVQRRAEDQELVIGELQTKVTQLQAQLQVSTINSRAAAEQVQAVLRELTSLQCAAPAAGLRGSRTSKSGGPDSDSNQGSNALLPTVASSANLPASAALLRANAEITELTARVRELEAEVEGLRTEVEAARKQAAEAREAQQSAAGEADTAAERMGELRMALAGARQQVQAAEERLRHAEADKETLGCNLAEARGSLRTSEERCQALERQVWELGVNMQQLQQDRRGGLLRNGVEQQ